MFTKKCAFRRTIRHHEILLKDSLLSINDKVSPSFRIHGAKMRDIEKWLTLHW